MNRIALALPLALLVAGCSAPEEDEEAFATSTAALNASMSTDGLDRVKTLEPRQAAAEAAVATPTDAGCRNRRIDATNPNVVYVTLTDCTKRFGRHVLDGEMKLTFSAGEGGALHVERESLWLTVDGKPASHRASTDITQEDGKHVARTRGVWQRTRDDGRQMTRVGEHTVHLDPSTRCRVSSGTSTEQIEGEEVGSGALELAWCELADGSDSCPVGEIEHERPSRGKRVVKRFDGTTTVTAEISTPRGHKTRQGTIDCTPNP